MARLQAQRGALRRLVQRRLARQRRVPAVVADHDPAALAVSPAPHAGCRPLRAGLALWCAAHASVGRRRAGCGGAAAAQKHNLDAGVVAAAGRLGPTACRGRETYLTDMMKRWRRCGNGSRPLLAVAACEHAELAVLRARRPAPAVARSTRPRPATRWRITELSAAPARGAGEARDPSR